MQKNRLWSIAADLYGLMFFLVLIYLTWCGHVVNSEFWQATVIPAQTAVDLPIGRMFVESFVVFLGMAVLVQLLKRLDTGFRADMVTGNINLRMLFRPVIKYPFAVLLVWNLPILAMLEEYIFRSGFGFFPIEGLRDVLVRSVFFGAFHSLITLNWRGGVVQTLLSLWFSYQFLLPVQDPLLRASYSHFLIDLLAVVPGIAALLLVGHRYLGDSVTSPCS